MLQHNVSFRAPISVCGCDQVYITEFPPHWSFKKKTTAKHSVFQYRGVSAVGLHNEATNISSTITHKCKSQSQEFLPLNSNQVLYDIMKASSLGNEGLRIIKSILIWKMLPRNILIVANGRNYHVSTYCFHGSSANYTTLVYWKMCLSKLRQNQGTLSR